MAYPSSREWHHAQYERIIKSLGWSYDAYTVHNTVYDSVANRYICSPIEIHDRCRVDRIGVWVGDQLNSGDVIFALHDSDGGLLPANVVCQTPATDCTTLAVSIMNFLTPTTTPTIEPGYYYIGFIAEVNFALGVAGLRWSSIVATAIAGTNTWNDGLSAQYLENVGSFTVPDPMTPVVSSEDSIGGNALRVTVML